MGHQEGGILVLGQGVGHQEGGMLVLRQGVEHQREGMLVLGVGVRILCSKESKLCYAWMLHKTDNYAL